ncbi:MAG: ParB N-terminal domain-containing protein [Candidatus Bathyarchaeia archaeon]
MKNFRYELLSIESIQVDSQYFGDFDINPLINSIRTAGIIYEPVVEYRDGRYILRDGHHRIKAAKALGMKQILCKVYEYDPLNSVYLTFDPNIVRRQLTPDELKRIEIKKKELFAKIKNRILAEKNIELSDADLGILTKLSEDEYNRLVSAIREAIQTEQDERIKALEDQLARKEEQIKKLGEQKVDIEKLRQEVEKKLREKEREIKERVMQEVAAETESEKLRLKQRNEELQREIEELSADLKELNRNLQETTKTIELIRKEKEDLENEKQQLQQKLSDAGTVVTKIRDELRYRTLELKKARLQLEQQLASLRDLARPESVLRQLESARQLVQSALEILSRVFTAMDSKMKQTALTVAGEIQDIAAVIKDVLRTPEPEVELTPEEEESLGIQLPIQKG